VAHILVVDDEAAIRELIQEVLSMDGHTCDQADNGASALEKLKAGGKYDLMIMDRNMPKMTGIQALQLLRSNAAFKELKVLMCTSASVNREVEEAFEAGATDYILKPINLAMLSGKVKKHLGLPK
jgi:CheY-like chemotaxis protein